MSKLILLCMLLIAATACNNDSKSENSLTPDSSTVTKQETNSTTAPETNAALPAFPSFVVFRNWQLGDPANTSLILDVYRAWDNGNTDSMAMYFSDSAVYDFPDGTRTLTTSKTVESTFRKWRHEYTKTSNIPFSVISLYNKDFNQHWVIAWTWNKWRYTDGKKDSALYCDNWRIREGKITYLNSLENHTSKALAKRLNENIPK